MTSNTVRALRHASGSITASSRVRRDKKISQRLRNLMIADSHTRAVAHRRCCSVLASVNALQTTTARLSDNGRVRQALN